MTADFDIWRAANLVIERHGADCARFALMPGERVFIAHR